MSSDLLDEVAAGYGEERFTMPLGEVRRRAQRRMRRNRRTASLVSAVLTVAAIAALGLSIKTVPPVVVQLSLPMLQNECQTYWSGIKTDAPQLRAQERTDVPPRAIFQRIHGNRGFSLYFNGRFGFECLIDGEQAPEGRIVEPEMLAPNGTDIVYYGRSEQPAYFWGWAPPGALKLFAYGDSWRATGELLGGGMFAVWAPLADLSPVTFETRRANGTLSTGEVALLQPDGSFGLSTADPGYRSSSNIGCRTWLQSPRAWTTFGNEALFSSHIGAETAVYFYTDGPRLLQCHVGPRLTYTVSHLSGDPLEQLFSAYEGYSFGFGRCPAGAVSGKVTLTGGQTAALQISQGYYFWSVAAPREFAMPARVDISAVDSDWSWVDGVVSQKPRQ